MKKIILLTLYLLLVATKTYPQNFPVGVFSPTSDSLQDHNNISTITSLGINWIINTTWDTSAINGVNVIGCNARNQNDHIGYYVSGMYNKFSAKENVDAYSVGIKHEFGSENGNYFSSGSNTNNKGLLLIKGPNYHQNMKYVFPGLAESPIDYNLRIKMRRGSAQLLSGDTVCKITVYYKNGNKYAVLLDTVMTAFNLSTSDQIYSFKYNYTKYIDNPEVLVNSSTGMAKIESASNQSPLTDGIQYFVKWYGTRELFIEYLELYDNRIWGYFISSLPQTANLIKDYANSHNFSTLKYWYGFDEPMSRDSYIPFKTIDSLLGATPRPKSLFTTFFPQWNNQLNNENQIPLFINTYNPKQFMFYYYPVEKAKWPDSTTAIDSSRMMFGFLKSLLSSAAVSTGEKENGFWYTGQAHAYRGPVNSSYTELRKPTMSEFNAQAMLALSYGAKGLFFYNYYSWGQDNTQGDYNRGLVGLNYTRSDLWYKLRDLTVNRLRSTLGNALLDLKYTGNTIDLPNAQGNNQDHSGYIYENYSGGSAINFHTGLFAHKNDANDNYFFIVNLICPSGETRTLNVNLQKPPTAYQNYRVYNVEGGYDWSFYDTTKFDIFFTAGEGFLYRVAPAVRVGGIIRAAETINAVDSLKGNLTIAAGASLTVNNTFHAYKNITVESGGHLVINAGKSLIFHDGAKLIINGGFTAIGNSSQRINIDFSSISSTGNGIIVNPSGGVCLNYCNISNAYYGLQCLGDIAQFSNNIVMNNYTGVTIENFSSNIFNMNNNIISSNENNGIRIVRSTFTLSNNEMRDNGNCGISCYDEVNMTIINNRITNNADYGIYINYNGQSCIGGGNNANLISRNRYGLLTSNNSQTTANYNCIYNNSKNSSAQYPPYDMIANYSSTINAQNNWWGRYPPDSTKIYVVSGSSIDFSSALQDPLCTGISKTASSGSANGGEQISLGKGFDQAPPAVSTPSDKELDSAFQLQSSKKYEEAIRLYDWILNKAGNSLKGIYALIGLSNCYRESGKSDFVDYMNKSVRISNKENSEIYSVSLELESNWLIAEKRYKDVFPILEKLNKNYPDNPETAKYAIFKTGYVYLTFFKDTTKAREEFNLLASKYPEDELVLLSREMLGIMKGKAGKSSGENFQINETAAKLIPTEYALEQNYPNPFNPVTTISYSLPVDSKVRLVVYNSLGQEVAVLADYVKTAGKHNLVFNASNLSSGVYFYSITAKSLDGTRKDFQSNKKMLLVK
jgi:tetratricopeptide (TPR) repeat protein